MLTTTGILILNKGEGLTSQAAVTRVRRLFGAAKAGHTGTLDPMATGVLPVLLGRATAASEFLLTGDKHYLADLRLGLTTDTEDVTGTVTSRHEGPLPTPAEVRAAAERFLGDYDQVPPMYSALKQGGRKLCDLARAGVTVEREARRVVIHRLTVEPLPSGEFRLDVVCSKGTYIRTLCADLGRALGTGGVMSALCRASAAGYSLAAAHTLEELTAMSEAERAACLLPVESVFSSLAALSLPPFFARLCHAGCEIYLKKLGAALPLGTRVRLLDDEGFFALGEVREYPDGPAVKPIRAFR
ncbi:MAG: tRNA pseudouridine(55) synthase TruB [Clostridia bacterium]|nr:tRNA pseudouridine(55) synthase TruB [Clostridia bacterium]